VNPFKREKLLTVNRKSFFMNILYTESFSHKHVEQKAAPRRYNPEARSPFWLLKPASEHVLERLLPRLSWRWAVLIPTDTHRKPITSITALLLPFMSYLLILRRIINLCKVYFTMLSVAQTTQHPMVGWLAYNELENIATSIARQRRYKHLA
jgi:hypothetical protein